MALLNLFTVLLTLSLKFVSATNYWQEKFPIMSMPKALEDAVPLIGTNMLQKNMQWAYAPEASIQDYEATTRVGQIGLLNCHDEKGHGGMKTKFLLRDNLKLGAQLMLVLNYSGGISTRFPSAQEVKTIPDFSSRKLMENLKYFSIEKGSLPSKVMESTLRRCELNHPIDGKNQHCTASLNDFIDYVLSTLRGHHKDIKVVSPTSYDKVVEKQTLVAMNVISTGKNVIFCHKLSYPYAVYYCHQPQATTAYALSFTAGGGKDNFTKAYVICHDKTEQWSPNYIGFKVLGVHPGTPICHFLMFEDLLWYSEA